MAAKPQLHTYEIVIRTNGKDALILRTTDLKAAKSKYACMRTAERYPRLIVDGKDLPIYIADKMCPVGQAARAAAATIKRKKQPAG